MKVKKIRILIGCVPIACLILVHVAHAQTKTILYEGDTTTNFVNPERGWFYSIEPNFSNNTSASPLNVTQLRNIKTKYGTSLIRKYYILYEYKNSTLIPQYFFDSQLINDLNVCREAGFKLIPRFTYNWNQSFSSTANQDASESITISHIAQIMTVLNKNVDVIDHLQAGFIGAWAEWHRSYYNHVDNYTLAINQSGLNIKDSLFKSFSSQRMIAMRYPKQIMQLYSSPINSSDAYSGSNHSRNGFYNDGFAYDATDYGTWSKLYPNPDPARTFMKSQTEFTIMSGEPGGGLYYSIRQTLNELKDFHYTSLSINQSDAVSKGFYTDLVAGNVFEEISKKFGYRYRLIKSITQNVLAKNSIFTMILEIANDGWAGINNSRKFEIVFRNKATKETYSISYDGDGKGNRMWLPRSSEVKLLNISFHLPTNMPVGDYEILLHLADPFPSLHDRPEYSIRLANKDIWEETTGYNKLLTSITVTNLTNTVSRVEEFTYNLYPNPASQELRVASAPVGTIIRILDQIGTVMIEDRISSEIHRINISSLPRGMYHVKMGESVKKICVQ